MIGRLTEESQFLWWLIGRKSPSLNRRRDQLTQETYAFPAAAEAAKRVTLLPPAASVASLIEEVLSQCGKVERASLSLPELIASVDSNWVQTVASVLPAPDFTPLSALLAERKGNVNLIAATLKRLRISAKTKTTPVEASIQYFKELMFLRAIGKVN